MKRTLSLLTLVSILFAFVGCSTVVDDAPDFTTESETEVIRTTHAEACPARCIDEYGECILGCE